jgi:arabinose-5-phosphate isomerase
MVGKNKIYLNIEMNKKNKILKSAKKAFSKELASIKTLSSTFNNNFYKAIDTINNLKGRVIVTGVGKSAHIGNKISATLTSTGTPSFFIHATEASHGDLGNIQKNDCVIAISNSGETSELNDIIQYSKRFNITLISITSNVKSSLHRNSSIGIVYKKPKEACPLNLAPTTSTSMAMIIGDCMAIALLELKGFESTHFKSIHPGGNLGKDLKYVSEIMHIKNALPISKENEKMSKALIKMTKKSFGCLGVINKNNKIVGIITDGDLRRKINSKFFDKKAHEIMTKNPTIAHKKMLVGEAINIMNDKKITSLFICEDKKPIGIVHIHDLLRLTS